MCILPVPERQLHGIAVFTDVFRSSIGDLIWEKSKLPYGVISCVLDVKIWYAFLAGYCGRSTVNEAPVRQKDQSTGLTWE